MESMAETLSEYSARMRKPAPATAVEIPRGSAELMAERTRNYTHRRNDLHRKGK
jgi:hypothetical protein